MKAFTPQRTRHLSDCEPPRSPAHLGSVYPPSHTPYLLPSAMDHYGALDPHHFSPAPGPGGLPPDCLMPLNNQLSSSSTFPRIHYNSHFDQGEFGPSGADSIGGISTGTMGTSMSMGMGLGVGRTAMITSGSATISGAGKMNRLPPNLLDQFEKQLPGQQDGFSTLQFHRSTAVTTTKQQQQQRTDSPGKIRYLVHSVQKLFAKSQSLENSAIKANMNGRNSRSSSSDDKHHRSKSKDRAKSEGTAKRRPRSNMSGYWSSDDLDSDVSNYRNPMAMMTLGRQGVGSGPGPDSQVASRYYMQGYSTISEHTLKSSKSNSDLKHQPLPALPAPGGIGGGRAQMFDGNFSKAGPWSTLTLGPTRQVCQKGSATLDRTLLKSKSVQQDLGCHFLQVRGRMPSTGEWSGTLGRSGPMGEIPCRRMRSGSYVKAMADLEDSEDSDGSPKPSPKSAARRQSYLRATQQSLSDQFPSRNCLPSLREFSGNRSLDNLDCIGGGSPFPNWDDDDFSQGCSTLGRGSCISQMRDMEMSQHYADELEDIHPHPRCSDPPDVPMPTCFRSRSHSYLRAIQAGCSQDDDTASMDSDSPPPTTTTTVRTYSNSTVSTCMTTCKKIAPPPVPPRTTSKPFISVTVQSSTESAQDCYPDRKSDGNSQSGRSNSSDSLDSTRANSLAKGTRPQIPVAAPREPQIPAAVVISPNALRETHNEPLKGETLAADEPPLEPVPRRKLSSIGIQVDCIQEIQAKVETPPPLARFQSIGVQVEDGWTFSRSSSMASRQETDSDTQDLSLTSLTFQSGSKSAEQKVMVSCGSQAVDSPPPPPPPQDSDPPVSSSGPSRQILTHRSTTQSSSSSFSESLDPALDPSALPPPDPWLESGNGTGNGCSNQPLSSGTACRRDGHWFLKLLQAETGRMEGWCCQMEKETTEHQLSEEVLGKVRSAVGSAQLLMNQKFQQFRGLCEQNLNVNANPRPTAQDLAGFWDLLQLSIEDISLKFDELYHLKSNDWKLNGESPEKQENQKQAPPVPKKPGKSKPTLGREKSTESVDKQRQEARKRLMAAKRAQSVKQNSATESADSIEIYVPEAQTRL
ncbi:disks large-associated protein 4 isoform X2 [Danio rerio]|uniref:Disks large-associated protein 4 isoform X2 n=6 Tax=Danio rerio TaxID=7955 RepID=A0AC58JT18_DANRE|nr:disks large-associated protein 4 isoform X1 [Danio rerio]|eukprot:XP_697562.6 disks large-associated protein 4 isoform X1 [Danio rerio]